MSERAGEQCSRLQAAYRRAMGKGGVSSAGAECGVDARNPLVALIEAEEALQGELTEASQVRETRLREGLARRLPEGELRDRVMGFLRDQFQDLAREHFERLRAEFLEWVFVEGPNPLIACRRLFMWAKQHRPDLLANMGFRELGDILGCEGATLHALAKRLFPDAPAAGWRKSEAARKVYAKVQRNNGNRNGGRKIAGLRAAGNSEAKL